MALELFQQCGIFCFSFYLVQYDKFQYDTIQIIKGIRKQV